MGKTKQASPRSSLVELLQAAQDEATAEAAVRSTGALQMVRRKLDSAQRHLDTHLRATDEQAVEQPATTQRTEPVQGGESEPAAEESGVASPAGDP